MRHNTGHCENCCIPWLHHIHASPCLSQERGGCLSFPLCVTLYQLGVQRADGSPGPAWKQLPQLCLQPLFHGAQEEDLRTPYQKCAPRCPPSTCFPTAVLPMPTPRYHFLGQLQWCLSKCKHWFRKAAHLSGPESGTKFKGATKNSLIKIKKIFWCHSNNI